jgi:hypothetical protein
MSSFSIRKSRPQELSSAKQIKVWVHRNDCVSSHAENCDFSTAEDVGGGGSALMTAPKMEASVQGKKERIEAQIVDIGRNGIRLESSITFEFQEEIVIEIPGIGESPQLFVVAQVRWTQPTKNGSAWSAGAILSENFPEHFLNEIAKKGLLDRRGAPRLALAAEAVGQWELSTEGFPLSVSDVSATGIGVVIDKPCEVGQRLRISFDGETQDADTITAKTVRQREVAGQYLVGCTILKGAPYLFLNRSVEMKCRQAVRKNRAYLALALSALGLLTFTFLRQIFV